MLRAGLLALARNERARATVMALPPARAVVRRFVSGEGLEDCIAATRRLVRDGLLVTIDHLGEDTTTPDQAEAVTQEYLRLPARLNAEGLTDSAEVSVKLSAIGQFLPDGHQLALAKATRICAAARDAGTTVTLDMEDHTATTDTLAILGELRRDFPETGGVLQASLERTPDDCRTLAGAGSRIRLCKGAYDEPASVAHRSASAVSAAYLECLRILMKGDGYPMVASHDPEMISAAQAYADLVDRGPHDYELQMLYGIRPDEQRRLAGLGLRVRVYVPYGADWYGYFIRRLAERPANLAFFARALAGRR